MRVRIVLSTLVVLWLLIGLIAAFQRGLFSDDETSCSTLGHTVGTIFVGPLNYMGVNPTIECPPLPEPSE
ncbi:MULTISPECIES: hypothetical protein [Nocardiopsis]|uniref:Uncharacterized protein n=2 Tax=Nocardiopsis TaxID=2013 RepID=A0A7X6RRS3_9ACTN|nr:MULTISPECIES: hypothetical protein [Nocardiopsis]MCK9869220.1 hypothetical protein [Nocardiopsis dassonvillei]NKY99536.1 hypothetical protein [Nocardiopsis alborubida]QUX31416.1 hypothetical protein KGD83_13530 [Nocardiopsis akebiae]WDZ88560.1 hypothetical protein PV789_16445 [Nocardiopsis sp. HUAS JQ3]